MNQFQIFHTQKKHLDIKPHILDVSNFSDTRKQEQVKTFLEQYPQVSNFIDFVQLYEQEGKKRKVLESNELVLGAVVYFPLTETFVAYPEQQPLYRIQTLSNQGLLTPQLQEKIRHTKFLVLGLSVGSSILSTLLCLGARNIVAFDGDVVMPANLNRLPLGFLPGYKKADLLKHHAVLHDPYGRYDFFAQPFVLAEQQDLLERNLPEVIIDECDDVDVKEQIRYFAQKKGIPVFSAADVGKGTVILDVETNAAPDKMGVFHNILKKKNIPLHTWQKFSAVQKIITILGLENAPSEMLDSLELLSQGKLQSYPQEITAVQLSSSIVVQAVVQWLQGKKVPSRTRLSLPEIFQTPTLQEKKKHAQRVQQLANVFFPSAPPA